MGCNASQESTHKGKKDDEDSKDKAATKIQKTYRGHMTRKKLGEERKERERAEEERKNKKADEAKQSKGKNDNGNNKKPNGHKKESSGGYLKKNNKH